jgi:hypothetical protein
MIYRNTVFIRTVANNLHTTRRHNQNTTTWRFIEGRISRRISFFLHVFIFHSLFSLSSACSFPQPYFQFFTFLFSSFTSCRLSHSSYFALSLSFFLFLRLSPTFYFLLPFCDCCLHDTVLLQNLIRLLAARYLRVSFAVTNIHVSSQPVEIREGGKESHMSIRRLVPHFLFLASLTVLPWRSSGSQVFCFQYTQPLEKIPVFTVPNGLWKCSERLAIGP